MIFYFPKGNLGSIKRYGNGLIKNLKVNFRINQLLFII